MVQFIQIKTPDGRLVGVEAPDRPGLYVSCTVFPEIKYPPTEQSKELTENLKKLGLLSLDGKIDVEGLVKYWFSTQPLD